MKSQHKSKRKYGSIIAFVLAASSLAFPVGALAADQFANDAYSQQSRAGQLAPSSLPPWASVVIVIGFIIVAAIMVHSVVVGRRKKHANYIKKV